MWSDDGRAPARAFSSAGKNVRGRRRGDLDNRAPSRRDRRRAVTRRPLARARARPPRGRRREREHRCGRRSRAPVSQRLAGRPTAVGCSSPGRPRTSGCSSASPALPESRPCPGSPSSSRAAARGAPSRSSTGGAARHRVRRDDSGVRVRLGDPGGAGGGMRRGVAPRVATPIAHGDRRDGRGRRHAGCPARSPPPSHLSRRSSPTSSRTRCWSSASRAAGWSGGWRCHPTPRTSPPTAAHARASS